MKRIITTGLLLISLISTAQLRIGLETNQQYYVDDEKIKLDSKEAENRYRSNTYLKLNYNISDFEFALQLESYTPKALISYNGKLKDQHIGLVFARYKNFEDGIDVTLGHMYEQFGSGLALRFWEDRTLGINNALFGGRVVYNMEDVVQLKILGGKQRIGMGFDFSDGFIYGADTEVNVSEIANLGGNDLKFGLTFVGRADDATHVFKDLPINTFVYGGRMEFLGEKFNFSAEFLQKSKDALIGPNPKSTPEEYIGTIDPDFMKSGNAFLVNLGYNSGNFSSNVNLRRLENFNFYSQRNLQGNTYNYGMINYIPSLTKQYEHSLQNIYVCQPYPTINIDMGAEQIGDIGGQFDMFYEAPEGSFLGGETGANFAINGSYWSHLPITKVISKKINEWDKKTIDIKGDNFFSLGERYYSDIGFEYRKRFSSRFNGIFSYLNQFYLKTDVVTHTISVDGTYQITDEQSIRLELQHQSADAGYKNWAGGLLEYTPTPSFSLFVQDLYNYGNEMEDKQIHYYTTGCSYTKGATRLAVSYGRQRGGTTCTGGVCREVPESNGFTINLTTSF